LGGEHLLREERLSCSPVGGKGLTLKKDTHLGRGSFIQGPNEKGVGNERELITNL